MFLKIEELREQAPVVQSMPEYAASLDPKEPTVVFRDYNEPGEAPYLDEDVRVFDFEKEARPSDDVSATYGSRPNVPGLNVYKAIKTALGPGGYCIHMADGGYTGYSVWELNEYMKNFDPTNLRIYISETFDCDDFAQVLQGSVNAFFPGIAFGTIWYGPNKPKPDWGHAVNLFYSYQHNKVFLIEPQSDVFYEFNRKAWAAWMVII